MDIYYHNGYERVQRMEEGPMFYNDEWNTYVNNSAIDRRYEKPKPIQNNGLEYGKF